jgi:polysaccharide pyruvyl transferase WcaK-like protein
VVCPYERLVGGDVAQEHRRVEAVAEAVIAAVRRGAVDEIVVLDLNSHPVKGDAALHDALEARLAAVPVTVRRVRYHQDPLITLDVIAGLRGIVTMRLHGAVFAYCVGTPAVMLAYHEKCYGWAESVGFPQSLVVDAITIDQAALSAALTLVMDDNPPSPRLPLAEARRQAWRNWEWLPGAVSQMPSPPVA